MQSSQTGWPLRRFLERFNDWKTFVFRAFPGGTLSRFRGWRSCSPGWLASWLSWWRCVGKVSTKPNDSFEFLRWKWWTFCTSNDEFVLTNVGSCWKMMNFALHFMKLVFTMWLMCPTKGVFQPYRAPSWAGGAINGLERRDFALERRDFALERRDFALQMRDFALKMRDFALKMAEFVSKMMNSVGDVAADGIGKVATGPFLQPFLWPFLWPFLCSQPCRTNHALLQPFGSRFYPRSAAVFIAVFHSSRFYRYFVAVFLPVFIAVFIAAVFTDIL